MFVGGIQIKAQALKFANEILFEDLQLKFSDSWIRQFKSCHGLHYKKAHGVRFGSVILQVSFCMESYLDILLCLNLLQFQYCP